MRRPPRHHRQVFGATPPAHSLCKYADFTHGDGIWTLVVAFDSDGTVESVVPTARREIPGAAASGLGDVCALVSILLTYGVSLPRIAEALPAGDSGVEAADVALARALVAFLESVEAAEGALVRSCRIASELSRLSTVTGETAR